VTTYSSGDFDIIFFGVAYYPMIFFIELMALLEYSSVLVQ